MGCARWKTRAKEGNVEQNRLLQSSGSRMRETVLQKGRSKRSELRIWLHVFEFIVSAIMACVTMNMRIEGSVWTVQEWQDKWLSACDGVLERGQATVTLKWHAKRRKHTRAERTTNDAKKTSAWFNRCKNTPTPPPHTHAQIDTRCSTF